MEMSSRVAVLVSGGGGSGCSSTPLALNVSSTCSLLDLKNQVATEFALPTCCFELSCKTAAVAIDVLDADIEILSGDFVELCIRHPIYGGIDFQHREGSKIGSGGMMSESQAALERKERLRKLALETIDITKDPYFFKNHLGTFECKLCFTLHPNEGNYLAHTQGKRHQSNLGRRAAMEAKTAAPKATTSKEPVAKHVIKIGRPGYKVELDEIACLHHVVIIRN
jgi:hypothetical protein